MPKIKAFEFISPDKWLFLKNAEVEQAAQRASEFVERHFYIENLEHHIEEYLRQWMLVQLTEVYHYPENWLWLANASKRNANIVVKDENNRNIALVAARFFGESDLDFEQAAHQLQSDLEEIETVRFGIVTDGRRIAFLCRNTDDQIGDYKTIGDLPEYHDLIKYLETNQLPKLPAPTNQKFQKLPPPKTRTKLTVPGVSDQPMKRKGFSLFSSKSKQQGSDRRAIAVVLGAILLILLGAWYITKSEPIASGQTPEKTTAIEPERVDKATTRISSSSVLPDKPAASNSAPVFSGHSSRSPQKSSRQNDMRELEPDGTIKLNREEMSVMQSRPLTMSPSTRNTPPKVAPPVSIPDNQSSNRKIIRLPSQSY